MQALNVGSHVRLITDSFHTNGVSGKITMIHENSVVVETTSGVTVVVSKNEVAPQTYLTEIENDGQNIL